MSPVAPCLGGGVVGSARFIFASRIQSTSTEFPAGLDLSPLHTRTHTVTHTTHTDTSGGHNGLLRSKLRCNLINVRKHFCQKGCKRVSIKNLPIKKRDLRFT